MTDSPTLEPEKRSRLDEIDESIDALGKRAQKAHKKAKARRRLLADHTKITAAAGIQHSRRLDKLFAALAQAQGEFPASAKASSVGQVGGDRADGTSSTMRKYNYADIGEVIEAVKPALSKARLSIQAIPTNGPGVDVATVTFLLGHSSGQWLSTTYSMHAGRTAQNHGSALTYLQRYLAQKVLMVAGDDDDGLAASQAADDPRRGQKRDERRGPKVGNFDPDDERPGWTPPKKTPAAVVAREAELVAPTPAEGDPGYEAFRARMTGEGNTAETPADSPPGDDSGDQAPDPTEETDEADLVMLRADWAPYMRRARGQMTLTNEDLKYVAGGSMEHWTRRRCYALLDAVDRVAKPTGIAKLRGSDRKFVLDTVKEQLAGKGLPPDA